ncbi:hypothetical protein ACWEFL_28760 [Streptomyces sp. NPDC004838]
MAGKKPWSAEDDATLQGIAGIGDVLGGGGLFSALAGMNAASNASKRSAARAAKRRKATGVAITAAVALAALAAKSGNRTR